jgi:6-phosphogluconolactonase
MSNDSTGNQVVVYNRATNGNLTLKGSYDTGGNGQTFPPNIQLVSLPSQDSLIFDEESQRFFAVNTGSGSIAMLQLEEDGSLTLLDTESTGHVYPISLAYHEGVLYVANIFANGFMLPGNITGFRVNGDALEAIPNSTQNLSATSLAAAGVGDIAFVNDGTALIVTEIGNSTIGTFPVANGVAGPGTFAPSDGALPFGFTFTGQGFIAMSNAGSPAPGDLLGTITTYQVEADGSLTTTGTVATMQGAACWAASTGRFVYVTNTTSGNLTGAAVADDGALTLLDADGITATTQPFPVDLAPSPDNGFLFVLNGGALNPQVPIDLPASISTYHIAPDGSLTELPLLPNLPYTSAGLVVR